MANVGYAPYEEAAAKGQARMSLLQRIGQVFAGAGQGVAASQNAQNPFEAGALGFAGAFGHASAARQAAEEYARKKIEAQQADEARQVDQAYKLALTERAKRPEPPVKIEPYQLPPDQQNALIDFETRKAKALASTKAPADAFANPPWYLDPKYKNMPDAKAAAAAATSKETPKDTSWIQHYVRTTSGGNNYLDVSEMNGEDKSAALRVAAKQGIPVAGSVELGQLQDIESAKGNISNILSDLHSLLPPTAQARAQQYPAIKLSQLLQTSAARTAFNSWRGAAIRNLRAVAGSKGLRLNQKEIDIAVKNDIPQITDTWEVANRKMETVLKGLDNAERPILRMNLSNGHGQSGPVGDPLGIR